MKWFIGPWIWQSDTGNPASWMPPSGFNSLDLRTLDQMSVAGGDPGPGLFVGNGVLGSDYDLLGEGGWNDILPTTRQKQAIPVRAGYSVEGETLQQIVLNLITNGADPDGLEACRPIVPTSSRRLEIRIGGQSHSEDFQWGSKHTAILKDALRKEFEQHFQNAKGGKLRDAEHHRRVLDAWCDKYKIDKEEGWKEFVPNNLQKDVPGTLKHSTTYTESFDRADSTTVMGVDLTWNQVSGTWGTYTNGGYKVASEVTNNFARAEHDVSSSDHYAEFTSLSFGLNIGHGPAARFSSSAETCYFSANFTGGGTLYLYKHIAGTPTSIGSVGQGWSSGDVTKVECNGSTIRVLINTVQQISVTDTAIASGTRGGVYSHFVGGAFDNWSLSDLAGGGGSVIPVLSNYYRRLRG